MLAKCEEAYFLEYDTYSIDKGNIGFYMRGTPYYSYKIISADGKGFVAEANATYKGRVDSWVINDKLTLKNNQNGCVK